LLLFWWNSLSIQFKNMSKEKLPDIGRVSTTLIDGLSIRYAKAGDSKNLPVLLTAPWPESIYSFYHLVPKLASKHYVLAIDLPGFGLSQSRPNVMAPEAMGDFLIKLIYHFNISRTHVVAPDVGTLAVLFAALKRPELFESLIIGGAAMQVDLADDALKDLIHSPVGYLANAGSDGIKAYMDQAAKLTPAAIIDDFSAASAGRRLEEAAQYVRAYITDCPRLEPQLSKIKTPSLILSGKNDTIVPPVNLQFLAARLPHNHSMLLDAEHRVWEEAAEKYTDMIISWLDKDYLSFEKA
jgi:pimeloyl-ACP methyl ester carboxylesterase